MHLYNKQAKKRESGIIEVIEEVQAGEHQLIQLSAGEHHILYYKKSIVGP